MAGSGRTRGIEKRLVVEYGITLDGVWLPLAMLRRLENHGPWNPAFTEATDGQERVLLAHGLAERHNQAGLHRGSGLHNLLDAIPFQPTVPFEAVAAEPEPATRGERTRVSGSRRVPGTRGADPKIEG